MDGKLGGEEAAPDFMTAAEVAAWLRVGLSTIYDWKASGRIPYVKFNGVVRFRRHQLTGWMQQHTTCPSVSSGKVSERISGARPRQLSHRTMVDAAARVKRRLISAKKPIQYGEGQ